MNENFPNLESQSISQNKILLKNFPKNIFLTQRILKSIF